MFGVLSGFRYQPTMFQFSSETFALGVCVVNSLLAAVKTRLKYLKCMAIPSLILAAKINEEDEVIASVKDLLEQSRCKFSTAEIFRMERVMMNKLHWDLYIATPMDFIHIFHVLLMSRLPQKRPFLQASLWTTQLQHCTACHQLWQFKGSILALAIITLELEKLTPDWFSVVTDLLTKAQGVKNTANLTVFGRLICCLEYFGKLLMMHQETESTELVCCKETVDEYLQHAAVQRTRLAARGWRWEQRDMDRDMDDFDDEDVSVKTGNTRTDLVLSSVTSLF